nr:unnamed protein product [Callosobruchus analis]
MISHMHLMNLSRRCAHNLCKHLHSMRIVQFKTENDATVRVGVIQVLGVALNFKDFADKVGAPYPKEPIVFNKFASVIIGPYDSIPKTSATNAMDWEGELVAVIGKKARNVKATHALDYVFGYTATQDLTAKDWIGRSGGQLIMCKNMDGFSPLGPCVVTKDELKDPHRIRIRTWVNGVLKQDGNTENMIFGIDEIIEYLSRQVNLKLLTPSYWTFLYM